MKPIRAHRATSDRDPATEALIVENLPLVGYLVSDLCARATHLSREDLASVGAIALVTAARSFDHSRGVPFGAYARHRILGALTDHLRSSDWAGRGARQRITAMAAAQDELASRLHRAPTVEELAQLLGTDTATVRETLGLAARRVTELDEDAVRTLRSEDVGPEDALIGAEQDAHVRAAVKALPERMREIIVDLYFRDRTVSEIAAERGVTHSAVSQQRKQAMMLLHAAMSEHREEASQAVPASTASDSRRAAYLARFAELRGATTLAAPAPAPLRAAL